MSDLRALAGLDWRRDVVNAINYYQQIVLRAGTDRMADAILEAMGYSPDEADEALDRAADEGLIECGVSTRTGWLTDKGRRLLFDRLDETGKPG